MIKELEGFCRKVLVIDNWEDVIHNLKNGYLSNKGNFNEQFRIKSIESETKVIRQIMQRTARLVRILLGLFFEEKIKKEIDGLP